MADKHDQDRLLDPLAAAHYLGVTPELLFQYTKDSFAKASRLRKLETIQYSGTTLFATSELDRFDKLLAEKWPSNDGRRPAVPKAILDHLRAESSNQCARCGSGIGVETAHIKPWASSKSHHPSNLIRICSACHDEHDLQNSLSTTELQALKERLIARTRYELSIRKHRTSTASRGPRPVSQFIGRKPLLEIAVNSLANERSLMVTGTGGIGKTELLVQAIAATEHGRSVFWIDVEKHRSTTDAFAALRTAIGNGQEACPEDKVSETLDSLDACVVFDGVERTNLEDFGAFEDALNALLGATSRTQIVVTSQYALHGFVADTHLKVGPLSASESSELLESHRPVGQSIRTDDSSSLLDFCDGHTLTIRLSASLRNYYGSAEAAMKAIENNGVSDVRLPTKGTQNSRTSLDLCLQTAFNALSFDAQELLLTLSEAPAGFYAEFLEGDFLGISNPIDAVAELRQWHLIEFTEVYEGLIRTHVLGPIRAFSIEVAINCDKPRYEKVLSSLAEAHQMMVAVLELSHDDPNETSYVVSRYEEELPNYLRLLEVARDNRSNNKIGQAAISIVRALNRYFFVRGLPEQGCVVMHDAAELAVSTGRSEQASALVLQLISTADRANDTTLLTAGTVLVDRIEEISECDGIRADMAMCRGILARHQGDHIGSERYAQSAFESYSMHLYEMESQRAQTDKDDIFDFTIDEAHNDISHALGLLGFSLLAQEKHQKAREAYRQALQHQRGASIGVNKGQTLHQLGSCESHLGRHSDAAELYLEAIRIFHFVGMEQYLSNSFGELGYALIDIEEETEFHDLSKEIVEAALSDLARDFNRVFKVSQPIDHYRAIGIIRKTFGCIATVSLIGEGQALGLPSIQLFDEYIKPINEQIKLGRRSTDDVFPLLMLDTALSLGFYAAEAERSYIEEGDISRDITNEMLLTVCNSHPWACDEMRISDWLSAFLTKQWKFKGADRKRLAEFVRNFRDDVVDHLDISRECAID